MPVVFDTPVLLQSWNFQVRYRMPVLLLHLNRSNETGSQTGSQRGRARKIKYFPDKITAPDNALYYRK